MTVRTSTFRTVGLFVLVAAVVPFVAVAVPQTVGADHSYVVTSGSMNPAIPAGSVVFVRSGSIETITEGDVITFTAGVGRSSTGEEERITHRVTDVVEEDGQLQFRTKGDANDAHDPSLVPARHVIGRVTFHVPYLGYVIERASTDTGILALIVVPALLLAVTELWSLGRALATNAAPERDRDAEPLEDTSE